MQDAKSTIVLLTFNYPYGMGEQFIEAEINFLLNKFERVIILPFNAYGPARFIPKGVFVDLSIRRPKIKLLYFIEIALRGFASPLLYQEIASDPLSARVMSRLLRMVQFIGNASRIKKRIRFFIENFDIDLDSTIFYTYWISFQTYGVGLAKSHYPALLLISRAHSGDIYEIQQQPPYFPFRLKTLSLIDRIFCASNHAKLYLVERYPSMTSHCEVSKLGVLDPGFIALPSTDTTFRIISNSFLTPIKRVDLLIQGIMKYANSNLAIQMEWHHIGDGPLRGYLENLASKKLPENVRWAFLGNIDHAAVYHFYKTHPVDVMVNVSKSEAISVSMMEAQSCGIPVIGTRVGGTPEIITSRNGILLESDPTPQEIANAFSYIVENKVAALAMRKESKNTWRTIYNAENNYQDYANSVFELISNRY